MTPIQFFGKTFRTTLLAVVALEIFSFFLFKFGNPAPLSSLVFGALMVGVLALTIIKPRWGAYIALGELFVGSQGHLLIGQWGGQLIPLRMGLFVVVMLAWLIWLVQQGRLRKVWPTLKAQPALIALTVALLWGIGLAFLHHNALQNIFLDFNAWIYFLYFFPFICWLTPESLRKTVPQILTASVTWLSIKSLFFLFVFSHSLSWVPTLYKWGRDSGWGEFTLVFGNFYRIFSQAHLYVLLGFFIILGYLIFKGRLNYDRQQNKFLALVLFLSLTTIILSLSRSFWLAGGVVFIGVMILALTKIKQGLKECGLILLRLFILLVVSYGLFLGILNFPYPRVEGVSPFALQERLQSNSAVASRWSALKPLNKAIVQHPVFGSGWGSTITYQSQDPRLMTAQNPDGWYTTYAFEWGYLDILLKLGLAGLAIYLAFIYVIFQRLCRAWQKNNDPYGRALILGLIFGLVALIITHGISPYLNHPLGIGYLLLLLIFSQKITLAESTKQPTSLKFKAQSSK